jgi:hydrogenase nickel incorporation protein HypB
MKIINVKQTILKANLEAASENRVRFSNLGMSVVNILGSPGSGKTSLLECLAARGGLRFAVLEGDPETALDAERIEKAGAPVVQIVTQGTCHLDAAMVNNALTEIDLTGIKLLFVENVGNLLCPASFDLGETSRIVVLSTPEGDDKPYKYPAAFRSANVVVVNKTDLLPYLDFSLERVEEALRQVAPQAALFPLSCKTGEGLSLFVDWLLS